MSKELVISSNRHETRVALIEEDQLVEVYFQRANEYSLAASIHKGRVTRVLPGMQSAFVDLGLERDTFLYVSDFLEEHEDFDKVTGDERPLRPERSTERKQQPPPTPVEAVAAAPAAIDESVVAQEVSVEPQASVSTPNGAVAPQEQRGPRDSDRGDRRGRRSR